GRAEHAGREHRCRLADGVLPFRRRQGQLLRRPQGARRGLGRVLHRQEGLDHSMVLGPALPRSRSARRGPAVALAASLLAAGPALSAPLAEGEAAPVIAIAAADSSLPAPDSLG